MTADDTRTERRYQPRRCVFLNQQVWAILTRQPDGTWRVVNCLEKDETCFHLACAFTTDAGEWPYQVSPAEPLQK